MGGSYCISGITVPSIDEFRKGCLKLQGNAKSREIAKLALHVANYNRELDEWERAMGAQKRSLEKICDRLHDSEEALLLGPRMGRKKKS